MKRLYHFTLKQSEKTTVEEKSTDENGAEVTTKKTVDKEVDRHIILRKPTRVMYDDAELFYGVELSKGIKAGLLTRALLSKRFSNDGGVMSEGDKEEYAELYVDMFQNQTDLDAASAAAAPPSDSWPASCARPRPSSRSSSPGCAPPSPFAWPRTPRACARAAYGSRAAHPRCASR